MGRLGWPIGKGPGMGMMEQRGELEYGQFMQSLFDIQVLPLDDPSGTVARDVGARGINGTYSNVAGLTLNNDLAPFRAPILGATSYVNHNATNIAAYFSYLTGTYHIWVKGSLTLWDDSTLRRLALFQADTSNRIDMTKNSGSDSLRFDYRAGAVSNYKDIGGITYTSGWVPIGIRWNKTGDVMDVFINGRKVETVSTLGDISGTISNASIGGNPYFPAGSLAYLGLGTRLVSDLDMAQVVGEVSRHKLIVFHGDSLTTGLQNGAVPYPKQLMRLYYGDTPVLNCAGYNKGESGTDISDLIATASSNVDTYISDKGFAKKICVFVGGTNDITNGADAATVESRLIAYWQARRLAGWQIVASTIIPNGAHTAGEQTVRAEVNTWIKANYATYAEGLADPTANAAFDEESDVDNATNYNADRTHLTTVGYGIVAGIVKTVVDAL